LPPRFLCAKVRASMSNRTALIFALVLTAAVIGDIAVFGDKHVIFLGKKLYWFIDWLKFWE